MPPLRKPQKPRQRRTSAYLPNFAGQQSPPAMSAGRPESPRRLSCMLVARCAAGTVQITKWTHRHLQQDAVEERHQRRLAQPAGATTARLAPTQGCLPAAAARPRSTAELHASAVTGLGTRPSVHCCARVLLQRARPRSSTRALSWTSLHTCSWSTAAAAPTRGTMLTVMCGSTTAKGVPTLQRRTCRADHLCQAGPQSSPAGARPCVGTACL